MAKTIKRDQAQDIIRVYEDLEEKSIWTYNYNIHKNGPISVEVISKIEPQAPVKKQRKKRVSKKTEVE